MMSKSKTPVILLTGFLGSGKTTFLNRILKQQEFQNSLVIVNEFGAVPVDHLLVEESAETIYELSNGCLCCNMRGELVETLAGLPLERFDRIFIETTGIADPLPVFQTLAYDPELSDKLYPSLIISVFDLLRGQSLLQEHAEARHQLAVADQILLTKDDLADNLEQAVEFLETVNATAQISLASAINSPGDFVSNQLEKPNTQIASHSNKFRSVVMRADRKIPASDLTGLLYIMTNQFGPSLLRVKGFAHVSESDAPVLVQVSGAIVHDLIPAPFISDMNRNETTLVAIVHDADPAPLVSLFDGFFGKVKTDVPDRDALLNNPLSVTGI